MAFETPSAPFLARPSFGELYMPKLLTVLREGYGLAAFAPMSSPADGRHRRPAAVDGDRHRLGRHARRGSITAIVGGFMVSALGGSRFQIGGPAGAFIVLVAARSSGTASTGCRARHPAAGADAGAGRLPAARHLHQIHPVSRSRSASRPASPSSSSPARSRTCSASTLDGREPGRAASPRSRLGAGARRRRAPPPFRCRR